jgi:CRP/FNR family transcriptional regulator, cyclic AMP receptor protein
MKRELSLNAQRNSPALDTQREMIGTTRSRVSFFMNKFRQLGFIEYNDTLNVHSSLLNVVLHDQPQLQNHSEASAEDA